MYVIWSNEHSAFWGPGRRGFVPTLLAAGRYDWLEVDEILANTWCPGHANCCAGRWPHEVALLVAGQSPITLPVGA